MNSAVQSRPFPLFMACDRVGWGVCFAPYPIMHSLATFNHIDRFASWHIYGLIGYDSVYISMLVRHHVYLCRDGWGDLCCLVKMVSIGDFFCLLRNIGHGTIWHRKS